MKTNELMIGDWVQVPCLIDKTEHYDAWCKVRQLRDDDLDVIGFKELKYNEIVPIPITPEILEKNGFVEFIPHNWQIVIDNIMIELRAPEHNMAIWLDWNEHDTGTYASYMLPRPDCVHELQHALKLYGINKEIEL